MEDYNSIVQLQDYGYIRVKLAEVMDNKKITRNKLRALTGVKYEVIDRYYKAKNISMVDLNFFAKVCCVLNCGIKDLLEYCPK